MSVNDTKKKKKCFRPYTLCETAFNGPFPANALKHDQLYNKNSQILLLLLFCFDRVAVVSR